MVGCVHCIVDKIEHSEHDEGAQVPRWKSRKPVCERILIRRYTSSPRKDEWIQEIRGERLQGIAEGASSAPCLASSSAALFPRRNECPGTHCTEKTVFVRSAREFEVKGKMEKRTGWQGQSESQIEEEKRSGRLVGAAETSKEHAEWRRLQWKNLNILGMLKRKKDLSATERAVGKYARAAFVKRKRNRAVCPKHQIVKWERVKVGESHIVVREREGSERERDQRGEKRDSTVKEGRFQGGERGQAKRASLGEVKGSMSR